MQPKVPCAKDKELGAAISCYSLLHSFDSCTRVQLVFDHARYCWSAVFALGMKNILSTTKKLQVHVPHVGSLIKPE